MTIRILLVEDDPVSRDIIASLLRCRGYQVDAVDNGFGALRLVQDHSYDLVFIDYHLPEMDGYALARLMRTLGRKTNANLNMVAITADEFGLAARRGADAIFDCMLTKPVDPEALYAFVEQSLGGQAAAGDFAPPAGDRRTAGQAPWRAHGIAELPRAAVFPVPSAAERASLAHCFRIVDAAEADCLVLTRPDGLTEVEQHRANGTGYLQPMLTLDHGSAAIADAAFEPGAGDSWSEAAVAITLFRARRIDLLPGVADTADFDLRLVAYLYVSERELVLRRDSFGRTTVRASGGFAATSVLEAVKRLVARGVLVARARETAPDAPREIGVRLTERGVGMVTDARRVEIAG